MRRLPIVFFTLMSAITAAAPQAPAASEAERFNAWLESSWEEQLKFDPITATAIGDERYNGELPDFTTAEYRTAAEQMNDKWLWELRRFDRKQLSGQDRLSYDILKSDLEQSKRGNRFPGWMQPINQFGSMPSFLAQMGSGSSPASHANAAATTATSAAAGRRDIPAIWGERAARQLDPRMRRGNVPLAMPIYEYRCTKCNERFTRHEPIGEHGRKQPPCPKCGARAVEPVFSRFFAKTVRKS